MTTELKPRFEDRRRTPGPLIDGEVGPVVDDVVVPEGLPYYAGGTISRRARKGGVKVPRSIDDGEVGSAQNGYNYNN